jgi:mRNA-degrading endonuclease toxin of MazEF toxin-antitoxin module
MVARGEVWLVTLDPSVGSEIRKTRRAPKGRPILAQAIGP